MYIKGLVNITHQNNACMCEMMLKGSKEALTVLIDTHVTQVERVERLCYVETRYKHISALNFLNIQPIFDMQNFFSFGKLSNHTIQCYVCQSMSKGLKVEITFNPFKIHSIGLYGWKGLSLSFSKLFAD